MLIRRASNDGSPRSLGPPLRVLVAMTCTLAVGTAHGKSSEPAADAGEPKREISFIEMIKQANQQYEDRVSEAIARGGFDAAREHVRTLIEIRFPTSPRAQFIAPVAVELISM